METYGTQSQKIQDLSSQLEKQAIITQNQQENQQYQTFQGAQPEKQVKFLEPELNPEANYSKSESRRSLGRIFGDDELMAIGNHIYEMCVNPEKCSQHQNYHLQMKQKTQPVEQQVEHKQPTLAERLMTGIRNLKDQILGTTEQRPEIKEEIQGQNEVFVNKATANIIQEEQQQHQDSPIIREEEYRYQEPTEQYQSEQPEILEELNPTRMVVTVTEIEALIEPDQNKFQENQQFIQEQKEENSPLMEGSIDELEENKNISLNESERVKTKQEYDTSFSKQSLTSPIKQVHQKSDTKKYIQQQPKQGSDLKDYYIRDLEEEFKEISPSKQANIINTQNQDYQKATFLSQPEIPMQQQYTHQQPLSHQQPSHTMVTKRTEVVKHQDVREADLYQERVPGLRVEEGGTLAGMPVSQTIDEDITQRTLREQPGQTFQYVREPIIIQESPSYQAPMHQQYTSSQTYETASSQVNLEAQSIQAPYNYTQYSNQQVLQPETQYASTQVQHQVPEQQVYTQQQPLTHIAPAQPIPGAEELPFGGTLPGQYMAQEVPVLYGWGAVPGQRLLKSNEVVGQNITNQPIAERKSNLANPTAGTRKSLIPGTITNMLGTESFAPATQNYPSTADVGNRYPTEEPHIEKRFQGDAGEQIDLTSNKVFQKVNHPVDSRFVNQFGRYDQSLRGQCPFDGIKYKLENNEISQNPEDIKVSMNQEKINCEGKTQQECEQFYCDKLYEQIQENSNNPLSSEPKQGIFRRAMNYVKESIVDRAAPDIPAEDLRVNEQLRERIQQTQVYQEIRSREQRAQELESQQLKQLQRSVATKAQQQLSQVADQAKPVLDKAAQGYEVVREKTQEAIGQIQDKVNQESKGSQGEQSTTDKIVSIGRATAQVVQDNLPEKETVKQSVSQIKDKGEDLYQQAKEKAAPAFDQAQKKLQPTLDSVKQNVQPIKDKAMPYIDSAVEKSKPYVEDVKEKAQPYLDQGKDMLSSAYQQAKDKASEVLEENKQTEIKDKAKTEQREIKDTAQRYMNKAKDSTQKMKYQSEDEWISQEKKDYMKQQARDMADKASQKVQEGKQKLQEKTSGEKMGYMKDQTSDKIQQMKDYAKDKMGEKRDISKEKVDQKKDQAREKMDQQKEKAQEKVDQSKEKMSQYKEQAKDKKDQKRDQQKERIDQMRGSAKEKVQEIGEQVKEKTQEYGQKGKEQLKNVGQKGMEQTKDIGQKGYEKVKDLSSKALEKTKETGQQATEKMKDMASTVKGKGENIVQQTKEKTNEVMGQSKDKVAEVASQIKDKTKDITNQAKDKIQGITGQDTSSKISDIKDKASEKAGQVYEKGKETAQQLKEKASGVLSSSSQESKQQATGSKRSQMDARIDPGKLQKEDSFENNKDYQEFLKWRDNQKQSKQMEEEGKKPFENSQEVRQFQVYHDQGKQQQARASGDIFIPEHVKMLPADSQELYRNIMRQAQEYQENTSFTRTHIDPLGIIDQQNKGFGYRMDSSKPVSSDIGQKLDPQFTKQQQESLDKNKMSDFSKTFLLYTNLLLDKERFKKTQSP